MLPKPSNYDITITHHKTHIILTCVCEEKLKFKKTPRSFHCNYCGRAFDMALKKKKEKKKKKVKKQKKKNDMPNIDDIEKIYFQFRKAQAAYNNRGFRMPKNFEDHFKKKLTEVNQKKLINITNWFNTKWSNIDPYTYFECGFVLHKKSFTYVKFFNEKVLKLYVQRDKNKKREAKVTKEKLIESAKFLKNYMRKNEISTLQEYIDTQDGNQKIAVSHYLKNHIDASFFVFLLKKGMVLNDIDRGLIPYVSKNYRNINIMLIDMKEFVDKIEKLL